MKPELRLLILALQFSVLKMQDNFQTKQLISSEVNIANKLRMQS